MPSSSGCARRVRRSSRPTWSEQAPGGVVVDFRDEEPVAAFFARVEREHRRLDVRFNNMGRMDPADADILLYSGMVLRRSSRCREREIRLTLSRGQGVAWTS